MKTWLVVVSIVAVILAVCTGVGFWMLNDTKAELASTQANLTSTQANLTSTQAQLTSTQAQLTEIKKIYPLRDFKTYSELEVFVLDNIQPHTTTADKWYRSALKVQELAMEQGYLVSAAISDVGNEQYLVFNLAVAGNNIWWWYPEEGELFQYPIILYK